MRKILLLCTIGLVVLLIKSLSIPCQGKETPEITPELKGKEESTIRRLLKKYETALNAGDITFISCFSENGSLSGMPCNMLKLVFDQLFKKEKSGLYKMSLSLTIIKISIDGNDATCEITQTLTTTTPETKEPKIDTDSSTCKLRKEDGEWKISDIIFPGTETTFEVTNDEDKANKTSPKTTLPVQVSDDTDKIETSKTTNLYYSPEITETAYKIAEILKLKVYPLVDKKISGLLDLKSMPLSVALLRKGEGQSYTSQKFILPMILPDDIQAPFKDFDFRLFIYWALPHEVTELTLTMKLGMLEREKNLRWFSDGVAEYIAYTVSKELSPETHQEAYNKRLTSYAKYKGNLNLFEWGWKVTKEEEKMSSARYDGALQFFIDLVKDYKEDIIPQLLKELKKIESLSGDDICRVLSTLTGEDIKTRLAKY